MSAVPLPRPGIARPWRWVPPERSAAALHAVPDLPARYPLPVEAAAVLESALLSVDTGGIAARVLDEIAPQYPAAVREALLRRFWDVIRPELESIPLRPALVYGEHVERRARAIAGGAAEVANLNRQLARAHCAVAFDHDASNELAASAAKICTALVRSGPEAAGYDVLGQAHAKLSRALAEATGREPCIGQRYIAQCAGVYAGLADLLKDARRSARDHGGGFLAAAYGGCAALARCIGIEPPMPGRGRITTAGAVARLQDVRWWRRQVRRVYGRQAENALRELGMVSRRAGLYVSDPAAERYEKQRARGADYLRAMLLVNELGEMLPLEQAHDASVSNPELRRIELMTRMAGCERYARECGHTVILANLTLPSRFHRVYEKSGDMNPVFDGSDVRAGAMQMQQSWAAVRKALGRRGITVYGFRCSEPHHDGTVHWHVMVCCDPAHAEEVRATIKRNFLDELDPDEAGAQERRVVFIEIDASRGSAVGYLAKYISKNIDGVGVGADLLDSEEGEAGRDATETCHRAVAHARTHGLRQFQAFGLPSITVWRELRRLRAAPGHAGLGELWRAASEEHDFAAFIRLMGGAGGRAVDRPLALHIERARRPGAYGEPPALRIRGLRFANVVIPTRLHEWQLMASARSAPTWTRGNNCPDRWALTDVDGSGGDSGQRENQTGPPGSAGDVGTDSARARP